MDNPASSYTENGCSFLGIVGMEQSFKVIISCIVGCKENKNINHFYKTEKIFFSYKSFSKFARFHLV